jgi:membrane protease YdiL (CAAX protease family)
MRSSSAEGSPPSREAWLAVLYFAAYFGYLWLHQEGEALHWVTLVLLPLGLLAWRRARARTLDWKALLASVGIGRTRWRAGLRLAVLAGVALALLQLLLSNRKAEMAAALTEPSILYVLPLAVVLLLSTAAFTEEFFFRGLLQTRLQERLRSTFAAVAITAVLFGLYHLPYAYLNPRWPSYGQWGEAVAMALGQGIPAGVILGLLYKRAGMNLWAPVATHALINSLPATVLVSRWLS